MHIPVSEAKAQLTDLVRRAEAGEEIVLTRHGKPAVRLAPALSDPAMVDRNSALRRLSAEMAAVATGGVSAERAADFLYDDDPGAN